MGCCEPEPSQVSVWWDLFLLQATIFVGLKRASAKGVLISFVNVPVEASIGQRSPFIWHFARAWRWRMQGLIYPGISQQTQKNQSCGISFLLLSIWGLSREKLKKKSVNSSATGNSCWKYFSKSNEPKCTSCLFTVALRNSRTHGIFFLS